MKVAKLKAMGRQAKNHVAIDYSKYEVSEAVGVIAEVMILPLYIGRSLVLPPLLALPLWAVFALLQGGTWYQHLPYVLLAWLISIPFALALGSLRLFSRVRQDVNTVFAAAVDTSKKAYEDARKLRQTHQGEGTKASFLQVFKGVTFMVILPSVHRVLERKIPLVGGLFAGLIDRVFVRFLNKRGKDLEAVDEAVESASTPEEADKIAQERIEKIKANADRYVGTTLMVLRFPTLLVAILLGLVTLLFEWMLWALFY